MAIELWERIEQIFGEALAVKGVERYHFVEAACGDDRGLCQEVQELLDQDAAPAGLLDSPQPLDSFLRSFELSLVADRAESADRVGPYRLVERLGQGGMGVVYRAERDDGAFSRQVAIKLLQPFPTPQTAARFEAERQILASLDHPHIARLLDGGTTGGGRPYVVMELVDGVPVDRWCEDRKLDLDARVDLMIEVCEAVAAAHRRLIVHRDLKPANILVTEDGSPKLLDFGIAKLLEPAELGLDEVATRGEQRLLTPAYASPEQLRGDRVTVATDVYLLGLGLYEVLSGRRPFVTEGLSLQELERQRGEEPAPPLGSPAGAGAPVPADLQAIVQKALRPEPNHRYPSVEQLAEDLRRYRRGLPVEAVQGSWRYRGGKFFRRHRSALSLVTAAALAVAGFGYFWFGQARSLERALGRAQSVEAYLEDFVLAADPHIARGEEATVGEALERGIARLGTGAARQPEVEASLRALLGRVFLRRGHYGEAEAQLVEAVETFRSLPAPSDAPRRARAIRARSDLGLARFYLAQDAEAADAAEALAREAAVAARSRFDPGSGELLEVLSNLSTIYCWRKKGDELEPLAAEILALARQQPAAGPTVASALALQALTLKNEVGDLEASRELYREALGIFRRLEGEIHPEVANLRNQLGLVALEQGRLEVALEEHGRALAIRERLYPDGGHVEIAQSHVHRGGVLQRMGRFSEAEADLRTAVEIYQAHPARGPADNTTVRFVIQLAELLLTADRPADAAAALEGEVPASWWTARPAGSRLLAWAESVLGRARALEGDAASARPLLERSASSLEANPDLYERQAAQSQRWLRDLDS